MHYMQCINSVECRRQSAEFQFKRTAALIPQKFTIKKIRII